MSGADLEGLWDYLGVGHGPRRILIVGVPGSGKSTLARQISRRLEIPWVEADRYFWRGASVREVGEFKRLVLAELERHDSYVIEGHFKSLHEELLPRATHLVYLETPLPKVAWRLLVRCFKQNGPDRHRAKGARYSLMNLFKLRATQRAALRGLPALKLISCPQARSK